MVRRGVLLLACLLFCAVPGWGKDPASLYRGQIEWARLKTTDPFWDRHAAADPHLLQFVRDNTTLNIDTTWHIADTGRLLQMSAYPFLFSAGIQFITDEKDRTNLSEYLQRGGFVFIDSCINTQVNPDPDVFLKEQEATFQAILPKVRIERLPDNHPIYRSCFEMKNGLPHTYMLNQYNPAWAKHGLYAVYTNNRFVSIISLSGLQCGWAGMNPDPAHVTECMKMMVNIYVYVVEH